MWSRFWQDFNSENDWQLPDVAPSQLQQLLAYPIVDSERARAEWIWRRRPKLVLGLGYFGYCFLAATPRHLSVRGSLVECSAEHRRSIWRCPWYPLTGQSCGDGPNPPTFGLSACSRPPPCSRIHTTLERN